MEAIILACGDSTRFASYTPHPKQFLQFAAVPGGPVAQMWENALFGLQERVDVVVAFRTDHHQFVGGPVIWKRSTAVWLPPTRGQADTLLQTLNTTNVYNQEVLVVNCDQGFAPGCLDRLIQHGRRATMCAALTFKASVDEASRWSYVDNHPWFCDAEEKQAIGTHALAGAYYFPDRTILVRYLTRLMSWHRGEPYLSQVYGMLPGYKVSVEIRRDDWYDWGTPDSYKKFIGES